LPENNPLEVRPDVPKKFITPGEMLILEGCGFAVEEQKGVSGTMLDLHAVDEISDRPLPGIPLENEIPEEERQRFLGLRRRDDRAWVAVLQEVLKRSREAGEPIRYFVLEGVMLDASPWGYAYFVSENDVKYHSTGSWITDQVATFMATEKTE